MVPLETISDKGKVLAYIVRNEFNPEKTTFISPPELNLQVGLVVYPASQEIARHIHIPLKRNIVGTLEVVIVKHGSCQVDIYNDEQELVTARELQSGDLVMLIGGGHGFKIFKDTILLEVKQGPYTGLDEKKWF